MAFTNGGALTLFCYLLLMNMKNLHFDQLKVFEFPNKSHSTFIINSLEDLIIFHMCKNILPKHRDDFSKLIHYPKLFYIPSQFSKELCKTFKVNTLSKDFLYYFHNFHHFITFTRFRLIKKAIINKNKEWHRVGRGGGERMTHNPLSSLKFTHD